jgi:YVTN family beta-propeller protein
MGGRVFGFGISPNGDHLYVPDFDENALAVVDPLKNRTVQRVLVGVEPFDAIVSPSTGDVFVANHREGTVSVIDPRSFVVTRTIGIAGRPIAIAAGADGRVYVATFENAIMSVASSTYAITPPIPIGQGPVAIVAGPRPAAGCFRTVS